MAGEDKTFTWVSDFDTNGLLYYLGTNRGTTEYKNPASLGIVKLTTSVEDWNGDLRAVVGRQTVNTYSKHVKSFGDCPHHVTVELPRMFILTHYSIRHGYDTPHPITSGCLRNWTLQGATENDDSKFVILKSHHEDTSLNSAYGSHTWSVDSKDVPYKFFRVCTTGPNSGYSKRWVICCCGLEFYGTEGVKATPLLLETSDANIDSLSKELKLKLEERDAQVEQFKKDLTENNAKLQDLIAATAAAESQVQETNHEIEQLKKDLQAKDAKLEELTVAARATESLESVQLTEVMSDVIDFVKAIQMEGRGLEKAASDWIQEEDGNCLLDVVTSGLQVEFLDSLPLKRIARAKAETFLDSLKPNVLVEEVQEEKSPSNHALDSLGLAFTGLNFASFGADVDVADAPANSLVRDVVEELFLDAGANWQHEVTSVRVFRNTVLQQMFDAQFKKLRIRRGDSQTPFHKQFNVRTRKGRLLGRFRRRFGPAFLRNCRANWLLAWQGTNKEAAESVVKTGFASLAKLDNGYYGRGIYNTPDAEFGCRYGLGEFGGDVPADGVGYMILSLLCVGLAYPVDREADYPPNAAAAAKSSLFGKPLKTDEGFDAHIAAVEEPHFQAANDPYRAPYLEVVVDQEGQLLPLAIIAYKKA